MSVWISWHPVQQADQLIDSIFLLDFLLTLFVPIPAIHPSSTWSCLQSRRWPQPTLMMISGGKCTTNIFWTSRATGSISMWSWSLAWRLRWPHWSRKRTKPSSVIWIKENSFQELGIAEISEGFWPFLLLAHLLVITQTKEFGLFKDLRHQTRWLDCQHQLAHPSLLTKNSVDRSQVFQVTSKELGAKVILKARQGGIWAPPIHRLNARYILEHIPILCLLHPQWPAHSNHSVPSWQSSEPIDH